MTVQPLSIQKPGRTLNRVLWGLQVLLAAAFVAAGGAKLAGVAQMVALFDQIGLGDWFRYFTGGLEVLAGIGLLWPRTTAHAAGLLALTMACAIVTHLGVIGGNPLPAATLGALSAFVAYRRWPRG